MAVIRAFGYPPVGTCIYCGRSDRNLSREHIIAKAISGNITLPKSSCSKCSRVTRGIEQECFAETLKSFRMKAGFPIKKKKGLPIRIQFGENKEELLHEMGGNTDPVFLLLPSYPVLPSLLTRQPPAVQFQLWHRTFNKEAFKKVPGADRIGGIRFNDRTFCRMFAKIAHSFAVAEFGLSGFRPLLPEYILGSDKSVGNYYVGCTEPLPANLESSHHLELLFSNHVPRYLVANIRLFSEYGTPNYMVVVGTVPDNPSSSGLPPDRDNQSKTQSNIEIAREQTRRS